ANKFTKALSKPYRYVLALTQHPGVSVTEEMDALDSYIFLMRMRFENAFTYTVNKVSSSEQHQIIHLTQELMTANDFKHNKATEESILNIQSNVDSEYITVENNIQPSHDVEKGGIGLKYITQQYKLYGKDVVVDHTTQLFMVKIPFIKS